MIQRKVAAHASIRATKRRRCCVSGLKTSAIVALHPQTEERPCLGRLSPMYVPEKGHVTLLALGEITVVRKCAHVNSSKLRFRKLRGDEQCDTTRT